MSHSESHSESPSETPKKTYDFWERLYIPELVKGVAITTRHFLRNLWSERDNNTEVLERKTKSLMATVEYPEQRVPYPPGYRGKHRLVPREDGKPRCVACYMCATACPSQCIYIEAGEYAADDANTASRVIEKYPAVFIIDTLRCVVCGLCVEACPKDALRMDTCAHVSPELERNAFVYAKERLLVGEPVEHPSDAWRHRQNSAEPLHAHKEAHTRIGDGH